MAEVTYPILFNRTILIDGSYFLHRMLAQPNQWEMQTTTGKKTGGIYGCIRSIFKEIQKYNYFPIVTFDGGLAPRRLAVYPNYKRNEEKQLLNENKSYEEKTEQQILDEAFMREYRTQRKDIIELLHSLGIPCIRIEGWEGDDLLYILSRLSKESIIVTDDRDLIQAVYDGEDRKCKIWRTMHEEMWDVQTLREKGLDSWQYINEKAIVGDTSDNIPSACYGVGEKTAGGLLKLQECCIKSNTQFPRTEEDLTSLCKTFDIPKRKAYINFDETQFNINMELMNLLLVDRDIDDIFINSLYDEVIREYNSVDEYFADNKLRELEMYSINPKNIILRVSKLKNYLKIEDENLVTNKSEEASSHLF